MKTYIELVVPLSVDAKWMRGLKTAALGIPVNWQRGHHHITLAFLDETPPLEMAIPVVSSLMEGPAPILTFDKINVFTAAASGTHIINLTCSAIPESFSEWVEDMRNHLQSAGAVMSSGFKLHITLGRVSVDEATLEELTDRISSVIVPPFTLALQTVQFREYRKLNIKRWYLSK